jgi:hypothetical protein
MGPVPRRSPLSFWSGSDCKYLLAEKKSGVCFPPQFKHELLVEEKMKSKKKVERDKKAKGIEVKDLAPEELEKISGGMLTPMCGDYKPDPNYTPPIKTTIIKR